MRETPRESVFGLRTSDFPRVFTSYSTPRGTSLGTPNRSLPVAIPGAAAPSDVVEIYRAKSAPKIAEAHDALRWGSKNFVGCQVKFWPFLLAVR